MKTLIAIFLAASCAVYAQDEIEGRRLERDISLINRLPARYLLSGATVHTVSGESIPNGQVLVVNGKIAEVGAEVKTKVAEVIDLNGMHLYPGIVSAASMLGLVEIGAVRATRDYSEVGSYTPDVESWRAVNPDSELIPVARAGGIAYVLPVPVGGVVRGQSGLVQLGGWGIEDMTVQGPVALHVSWPSMNLRLTPKHRVSKPDDWKSPEDQDKNRKKKIKELKEFFADARAYLKAKQAAGNKWNEVPAWEAMLPYLARKKPVMVHANDIRQIKGAVEWAREEKLNLIICGARDAWRVPDLLATNGVSVVYEHVFEQPARDFDEYDSGFRAPGELVEAGVKVAITIGTGRFGASIARDHSHAAAFAAAHGMPVNEAIRSLTLYPAQMLGVDDRIGSIEVGKLATLIAVDRPLLDIRGNVKRMWIQGEKVSLESRHTKLYEKYRRRPVR
ncbi:MAG: amidohydrolase [Verrucomicrobiales bacterium]|nr:amidohydrolase [Verrucomicrobiales bacterium]|tara:strand:- start:4302 stop:5645 length:1344 start_codon:yes stop_codon:yes gene_type:complete